MFARPVRRAARAAAAAAVVLAVFGGCRMNYLENVEAQAIAREVPDLVVSGAQYRIVRDDALVMSLEVDRAETYAEAGRREMTGVRFTQYDRAGAVVGRGVSGRAVQVIQSEDVAFSGGLEVEIVSEKARIKADGLNWTAADKVLRGLPADPVEISRENGSIIRGKGLYADLPCRTIELGQGVEGVIAND